MKEKRLMNMALLLDPLFSPKSVAVIGASANQDRTGYKFTHELLMRFPGKVFPINPKGLLHFSFHGRVTHFLAAISFGLYARFIIPLSF